MSSTDGVDAKVQVGIFTPIFSYPSTWTNAAIVNAALLDLELEENKCEFLRLDDGNIACVVRDDRFMLMYRNEHKQLLAKLARTEEGLSTFHAKYDEDSTTIRDLREQLKSATAGWELKYKEEHNLRIALQGKLDKLKKVVNKDVTDTAIEPSRPKIPKLQLSVVNGKEGSEKPSTISESRNGVMSPRHSPLDPHLEAPRFPHGSPSPRENTLSPIPQAITNVNGKRSMSNLTISAETIPYGNGKHTTGGLSNEASPRATLSPRSAQASPRASPRSGHTSAASHVNHVKEHLRRHSTNFGGVSQEEGVNRRHSNSDMIGKNGSPRSRSSSEIPPNYFDSPQPDSPSLPLVHSWNESTKRKGVSVHIKSRSEAALPSLDVPAETLTQLQNKHGVRKRIERAPSLLSFHYKQYEKEIEKQREKESGSCSLTNMASCRLCACAKFRNTNVEWMCSCGHANIKHAVFLKASPAPSPTVSPRKIG